jgi:hypothetical protein
MTRDDNDSGPVTFVDMVLVLLEDQFRGWPLNRRMPLVERTLSIN